MTEESELIKHIFAPLTTHDDAALNLKDDAAVIPLCNEQLVVTKDAMVANVHFFAEDAPEIIAKKLLRCNLSDIAAMGATPKYYLIGFIAPKTTSQEWIEAFYQTLHLEQCEFNIQLIGGDTVSHSGSLTLSLTAIGLLRNTPPLLRTGATAGDSVYVSGTIGDSYTGLQIRQGAIVCDQKEHTEFLINRYNIPIPRMELGSKLAGKASACMDISDGLIQDATLLIEASNDTTPEPIHITLDLETIPFSFPVKNLITQGTLDYKSLINGGDDYELLFTGTFSDSEINIIAEETQTPITKIGTVRQCHKTQAGTLSTILNEQTIDLSDYSKGYQHQFE